MLPTARAAVEPGHGCGHRSVHEPLSAAYQIVVDAIQQILAERGDPATQMTPAIPIANTPLDSLEIVALVSRLGR
jgi:hypothetical protein